MYGHKMRIIICIEHVRICRFNTESKSQYVHISTCKTTDAGHRGWAKAHYLRAKARSRSSGVKSLPYWRTDPTTPSLPSSGQSMVWHSPLPLFGRDGLEPFAVWAESQSACTLAGVHGADGIKQFGRDRRKVDTTHTHTHWDTCDITWSQSWCKEEQNVG